jgi:hypothetical protein
MVLAFPGLAACGAVTSAGVRADGGALDAGNTGNSDVDANADASGDRDAPVNADASADGAPKACDLTGTWTLHCQVAECASTPPDRSMTLTLSGTSLTITEPYAAGAPNMQTQTLHATLSRGQLVFPPGASDLCPDIPAGLSFSGAVAQDCRNLGGDFTGECVHGTWSASKMP